MKTCSTCQHATTQKVWHLFKLPYCGHPASAHPVTGAPTIPCATAREGHSCESCRPAHCGIDARLYRAPDAPQRPRWLSETKPAGFHFKADGTSAVGPPIDLKGADINALNKQQGLYTVDGQTRLDVQTSTAEQMRKANLARQQNQAYASGLFSADGLTNLVVKPDTFTEAEAKQRAADAANHEAQQRAAVPGHPAWIQTLSDAVHGVKR